MTVCVCVRVCVRVCVCALMSPILNLKNKNHHGKLNVTEAVLRKYVEIFCDYSNEI